VREYIRASVQTIQLPHASYLCVLAKLKLQLLTGRVHADSRKESLVRTKPEENFPITEI